jgi:hypothetical protein
VHRNELLFQSDAANKVQEKRLARTVFADHQPEARATFHDSIEVSDHRLNFSDPAYLDKVLTRTRHHSSS